MIYTYASSYISGFGKIIEDILKKQIPDITIIKHLDGLIIYKTKSTCFWLKLPCMNNTYQVLAMSKTDPAMPYETALKKFVQQTNLDLSGVPDNINLVSNKSFKILPFDSNSPTKINFEIVKSMEQQIRNKLKLNIGLKRHNFDVILLRRREGTILLLFKLTYNRTTEKNLPHGTLRPELCNIMAWISDLKPDDIILDPFCGHGSIPKEIVKHFKYNMLFASDLDTNLINKLKNEFKKNKKNIFIKQRDALNLEYFQDVFFDKIITDPPWNTYNSQNEDFSLFYNKMLQGFYRILKNGGICTILMGNVQDFEKSLATSDFILKEKYHILVNGKKANVYKLTK
ncbi:MAG: methyltransferase domain-containing protein [Alphaproteobacteria bacterium]|nr:methyltransferase domain-containing protein [Alphaproteobacteria bacterium]